MGATNVWARIDGRRTVEFGTVGEMRHRLVGLVVAGAKVATAGLLEQDYQQETEPLEHVGEELAVVDDLGDEAARKAFRSPSQPPSSAFGFTSDQLLDILPD